MIGRILFSLAFIAFEGSAQTLPKAPVFVTAEQLPILTILPTAPANDSERAKAEPAEVHRLQHTRQPSLIARAKADDAEEDMFIFKDVLGEKFSAAALPLTALFSAHVHSDEGIVVNPAETRKALGL